MPQRRLQVMVEDSSDATDDDHVPCRGSIDQEPLLIELENPERRFVFFSSQDRDHSHNAQSQETNSRTNALRTGEQVPLPASTESGDTEAGPRRQPSPYSFVRMPSSSRPSTEWSQQSDTLDPSNKATSVNRARQGGFFQNGKPNVDGSGYWLKDYSGQKLCTTVDTMYKPSAPSSSSRGRTKESSSQTGPFSREMTDSHAIVVGQCRPGCHTPSPTNTSAVSCPTETNATSGRRRYLSGDIVEPAALPTQPAISKAPPPTRRSESFHELQSNRNVSSYNPSLSAQPVFWTLSPPDFSCPNIPSPSNFSHLSSPKTGSQSASRSSSPVSTSNEMQLPSARNCKNGIGDGLSWARWTAQPYVDRTRPTRPTPLSTSIQPDTSTETPQVHSSVPVRANRAPLPYPDGDGDVLMPSELFFQTPPTPPLGLQPKLSTSDQSMRSPIHSLLPTFAAKDGPSMYTDQGANRSSRPLLPIRPSSTDPITQNKAALSDQRPPRTNSDGNMARKDLHGFLQKQSAKRANALMTIFTNLPTCPMKDYSRKYNNWYTTIGYSSLNICPHCMDDIIRPTPYRKYFTRRAAFASATRTTCDFGSPWIRLAWLLSIRRQRPDLDLLYGLNAIAVAESQCPGLREQAGNWYGLRDGKEHFLPSFAVCSTDRKRLEALFPSIINILQRLPQPSSLRTRHYCSLRTDSRRFSLYVDAIVEIDETARLTHKKPDMRPLIALIQSYMYKQECRRDAELVDSTWHFIPSLPECTVCEECFDSLVWPHIRDGTSELATGFNMTLQPLPPVFNRETSRGNYASSCQLYSPRMQRVWERAAKTEDFSYLSRKVRERRRVEEECRSRQDELRRLLDRSTGTVGKTTVYLETRADRDAIRRELEAIEREWAEWE